MEEKDIQNAPANENAEVEENSTETAQKEQSERTYSQKEVDELLKGKFSQEQVNEMIEKRLAREKKLNNSNVVPNDYNNIASLQEEIVSLHMQLAENEKQVALSKYRIDERYQDYVDYKVLHMTSKEKDYATALDEFFSDEENKRFLIGETQSRPIPRPKNSNTLRNDNVADNNLRAAFGLAQK